MTEEKHLLTDYRAFIFDWDGVIADTYRATYKAYKSSLKQLGIYLSEAQFKNMIPSSDWRNFYALLGVHRDLWEDLDSNWILFFSQANYSLRRGVKSILNLLGKRQKKLGLLTAGSSTRVRHGLHKFDLEDRFDAILFREDTCFNKPDPRVLTTMLKRLQEPSSMAVYIGDSPDDLEMGRRARVLTVAVASKFFPSSLLSKANPAFLLSEPAELFSLI